LCRYILHADPLSFSKGLSGKTFARTGLAWGICPTVSVRPRRRGPRCLPAAAITACRCGCPHARCSWYGIPYLPGFPGSSDRQPPWPAGPQRCAAPCPSARLPFIRAENCGADCRQCQATGAALKEIFPNDMRYLHYNSESVPLDNRHQNFGFAARLPTLGRSEALLFRPRFVYVRETMGANELFVCIT
jgi:hypothetical protein